MEEKTAKLSIVHLKNAIEIAEQKMESDEKMSDILEIQTCEDGVIIFQVSKSGTYRTLIGY